MNTIGATALSTPGVEGIFLKTHIKRVGTHLVATTYVVGQNRAGMPDVEIFKVEVDAAPIMKRLMRLHQKIHEAEAMAGDEDIAIEGFFDDVGDFAKKAWKVTKSKVVRKVYKGVKSVVRSKITAGVVSAAAVAFPAVGAPAAAALAAANVALDYAESGRKAVRSAERVARKLGKGKKFKKALGRYGKKHGKKALRSYLKRNPKARKFLKSAAAFEKKVKAALTPKRKKQLKAIMRKAKLAKKFFSKISNQARFGKNQERIDARKMARIVRLAAENRKKIKAIAQKAEGGLPGILIDSRGNLRKGRYIVDPKATGPSDILVTPKGLRPGNYKPIKVSKKKLARLRAFRKRQKELAKKLRKVKRVARKSRSKSRVLKAKRARAKKALAKLKRKLKRMPPKKRRAVMKKIVRRVRKAKRRAGRARGLRKVLEKRGKKALGRALRKAKSRAKKRVQRAARGAARKASRSARRAVSKSLRGATGKLRLSF